MTRPNRKRDEDSSWLGDLLDALIDLFLFWDD